MKVFDFMDEQTLERLQPSDFDTDTHWCIACSVKLNRPNYAIFQKKNAAFVYYKVICGNSTLIYRDLEDVKAFIREQENNY